MDENKKDPIFKKEDLAEKDNIEELMKKATEGLEEEKSSEKDPRKKSAKKVIISASAALVLFISALGYGAYVLKSQENFVDKTAKPTWVTQEEKEKAKEIYTSDFNFKRPVEVKEWAKIPFDESTFWEDEEKTNTVISEVGKIPSVVNVLNWIPSGEKNKSVDSNPDSILVTGSFTNDIGKMHLENGEENEMFSYVLREDYTKTLAVSSERLLNPVFGNWSFSGSGENFDIYSVLYDVFDEKWWVENITSHSNGYKNLPILEDWTGKSFDNLNLKKSENGEGSFYGEIKEDENRKVIAKTKSYSLYNSPVIEFKLPVEFSAFLEGGGVLKKYGTLSLTLSPNEDPSEQNRRVVVSDAKLKMEAK